MNTTPDRILTKPDVCRLLGINRGVLIKWQARGILPAEVTVAVLVRWFTDRGLAVPAELLCEGEQ